MTQQPGAAGAPTCPRHPDRVSYVRCQRCERPACPECQRPAAVGVLCVDCLKQAQAQARPVRSRLGFTMSAGPPVVTYALIGLNVLAYLVGSLLYGSSEVWQDAWGMWPGLSDAEAAICNASAEFWCYGAGNEWYRWVTAGFTHFGPFHIGMNMLALWQLGQALEPALGRWRFLALYAGGLVGSAIATELLGVPGSVHAGASGAIFGLLAAYGIVLKRLRLPYTSVLVIAAIFIGGPLVAELIPGLAFFSGLSWQGHLGGAVAGALIMLAMFRGVDRRERTVRASA
ncbi:rhomboid family intramembrane serine protease [Demequina activiva]|uniref:Rhomboid family intramembrane serine protease n=1 Tax=Demequina activiva TaxID=1582364 RepID=A0A919UJR8_9MICO|nr:rhomboid family intramembrane serine protease [Demequina activiva]GIG54115.1 rhomboid family intramembrane serine protease [Demequina activiva]